MHLCCEQAVLQSLLETSLEGLIDDQCSPGNQEFCSDIFQHHFLLYTKVLNLPVYLDPCVLSIHSSIGLPSEFFQIKKQL